jgi:hypothetical protein
MPASDDRAERVAGAANQPEAEMIATFLESEGIPTLTRPAAGFEMPYAPLASPWAVFARSTDAGRARQLVDEHFGAERPYA